MNSLGQAIHKIRLKNFLKHALLFIGSTAILYAVSLENYLVYHSLAEVFSIVIGGAVFLVMWHARDRIDDNFQLLVGIGIVFVIIMDLIHTLAYKGLNVFDDTSANLPTQLWIAARYLQSLLFLTALVLINIRFNLGLVILFFCILSLVIYGSIFAWDVFPVCYIEGQGLTGFKIISEYIIIGIILISMGVLYKRRAQFDKKFYGMLQASFVFSILSELSFTQYISVFGFMNFAGHIFKIYAFYHLYSAFVSQLYIQPYRKAEMLSFENAQRLRVALEGSNISVFSRNKDRECSFAFNPPFGLQAADFINKHPQDIMQAEEAAKMNAFCEQVSLSGESIRNQTVSLTHAGETRWFELSSEPMKDRDGSVVGSNFSLIDITEHVKMEDELITQAEKLDENMRELQCLFNVMKLTHQNQSTLEEIFEALPGVIPEGFPADREITAKIRFDGKVYGMLDNENPNFGQHVPIRVNGIKRGTVAVSCANCESKQFTQKRHSSKKYLLQAVADEIGHFVARYETDVRLSESEAYYRQIFNGVREGIEIQTLDGIIVDVNQHACEIFGYERDDYIGRHYSELQADPDTQRVNNRSMVYKDKDNGYITFEEDSKRANGEVFPTSVSLQKHHIKDQVNIIALIQDLSAKKAAENELAQSRQRYEQIFNGVLDAILLETPDGRIVDANVRACALYGLGYEEIVGRNIQEFIAPGYKFHPFAEVPTDRLDKPLLLETVHQNTDGHTFPVEITGHCYLIGEDKYVIAVIRDIRERKAVEASASASEERYRRIFNGVQDAIMVENFTGDILDVNERACQLYGYSREEFIQMNVREIITESMPVIQFPEVKTNEYYNPALYETTHQKKDGTRFPVELGGHKFDYGDDRFLIVVIRDVSERKQSQKEIRDSLKRITALHNIEKTINTTLDMDLAIRLILDEIHQVLKVDACNLLLFNNDLKLLEYKYQTGFRSDALTHTSLRPGEGLAGKTALERKITIVPSLSQEEKNWFIKYLDETEGFEAYFAFPLLAKGKLMGVLEIMQRCPFYPDSTWMDFAKTLSDQLANAIESGLMFHDITQTNFRLKTAYDMTLKKFAASLTAHHIGDSEHINTVAVTSMQLAERMHMRGNILNQIYRGAILHDIGEAAVPNSIMTKQGALTAEERKVMEQHPLKAAEMLVDIPYLKQTLDIPLYHHERWDGSGYPHGLRGEMIPLAARLFAVVDVWDALSHERPWRLAWEEDEILNYLKENAGGLFDPQVVQAFLEMLDDKNIA